jgi:TetR/AcrR family transcriptional regulator, tetracycline repressor protein
MTSGEPPGRRGRRPLLESERVIDAALAILDADGLGAVSFRRLSADLGVSHMTLYGYFESKDALLDALVARTIDVPAARRATSAPWEEALLGSMQDIHDALVSRPGIAELLVSRELTGDWVAQVREQLLDVLRDAGYDQRQATDGISVLFNYLLGAVMIETRRGRGGSTTSFQLGLRYLIAGLKSDPP